MLKINKDTLSEKDLKIYHNLDDLPFGSELAEQVAVKLHVSEGVYHGHRDYCGLGLFYYANYYTLGSVYDGYDAPNEIIVTFKEKTDFVNWLAKESDQSMSVYGERFNNQTITKIRLEWFLEEQYSPVWNDYRRYIRERNLM